MPEPKDPDAKDPDHGFDGDYARDPHRGGLGDNYARDTVRDESYAVVPNPGEVEEEPTIGKARE
jgi:hypothetical protein